MTRENRRIQGNRPFARPGHVVKKIRSTGEQIAQWDFQNKGRCIVLEVPLRNLLTSIFNFVPCDRFVQRAYTGEYKRIQANTGEYKGLREEYREYRRI